MIDGFDIMKFPGKQLSKSSMTSQETTDTLITKDEEDLAFRGTQTLKDGQEDLVENLKNSKFCASRQKRKYKGNSYYQQQQQGNQDESVDSSKVSIGLGANQNLSNKKNSANYNEFDEVIKECSKKILEKILLNQKFEESFINSQIDGYAIKDQLKNDKLQMILLVFYNQYYIANPEQIQKFGKLELIDFPALFENSETSKVATYRKIQKVKTIFKRFLAENHEIERMNMLDNLSLKSEYKEYFMDKHTFALAKQYFEDMNFCNKYHSDIERGMRNYISQLFDKISYAVNVDNVGLFVHRYIIQDQNPFIWSRKDIIDSAEAFQDNCSIKYQSEGLNGDLKLFYEADYQYIKKKKRQRENQRIQQRRDKIEQEIWLAKLFGLSTDDIEKLGQYRCEKREVKEKKARETLNRNFSVCDNNNSKSYLTKADKFDHIHQEQKVEFNHPTNCQDKFDVNENTNRFPSLDGANWSAYNNELETLARKGSCGLGKRQVSISSDEDLQSEFTNNSNKKFKNESEICNLLGKSAKPSLNKNSSNDFKGAKSVSVSEDDEVLKRDYASCGNFVMMRNFLEKDGQKDNGHFTSF